MTHASNNSHTKHKSGYYNVKVLSAPVIPLRAPKTLRFKLDANRHLYFLVNNAEMELVGETKRANVLGMYLTPMLAII